MAKFQDIRALAKQQLQAVTKNGECWKAFLHTASIAYNYNFPLFHHLSTAAADATDIFCICVTKLLQIGYSLSASTTA